MPVSEIPEELIEEAMAVLQGKSRDVVIRELQRTVSANGWMDEWINVEWINV